jgi:polar amino acid transport system permease protein
MIDNIREFLQVYVDNWSSWGPQIYAAVGVTIQLTVASFSMAIVLGLLLALGKISRFPLLRAFCVAYVEVARGIPVLAILFLLYFGLVPLGIVFDAFTASVIGLGLSAAGYIAEVLRAGIQAIHKGQREAALAVGMTPMMAFQYIILPQAFRIISAYASLLTCGGNLFSPCLASVYRNPSCRKSHAAWTTPDIRNLTFHLE